MDRKCWLSLFRYKYDKTHHVSFTTRLGGETKVIGGHTDGEHSTHTKYSLR